MLCTLLLQSFGFTRVTLCLSFLVKADGCFLLVSLLGILLGPFAFLSLSLHSYLFLLSTRLLVTLAHLHNVYCLFLSLLNFFPGLNTKQNYCSPSPSDVDAIATSMLNTLATWVSHSAWPREEDILHSGAQVLVRKLGGTKVEEQTYFLLFELEESDAIREEFHVVLGPLLRLALLGKGAAHHHLACGHAFVAILGIIHLLQAINIVGHHWLMLHIFVVLLLRAPILLRSRTLLSHWLLLHHLHTKPQNSNRA